MARKFSIVSCPGCHFNNGDHACMNQHVSAPRASEWERQHRLNTQWTAFNGSTDKLCHKRAQLIHGTFFQCPDGKPLKT